MTVTICACDGTDAPGTCLSCQPFSGGGGGAGSGYFYEPTCYYFYDEQNWRTCAEYRGEMSCEEGVDYILTDVFCA